MEFEFIPFLNVASICTCSTIIIACLTIFYKLKIRWPMKVNCWFCNSNTLVWRNQLNWWLCPSCEQYNGFTKNGDYMHSIPEQGKISIDSMKSYTVSPKTNLSNYKNGLCNDCNVKEELKLLEIRRFENSNMGNMKSQIQKVRESLEKKYPLCTKCEKTIENTLYKQSLWLAEYKMLFFKHKPLQAIFQQRKKLESVYQIILTLLNLAISCNSIFWLSLLSGTFVQATICVLSPARRKLLDVLLVLFWVCISILSIYPEIYIFKINVNNDYVSLLYITKYHMITLLRIIIALENIKMTSCETRREVSFKRLKTSIKGSNFHQESITNSNFNFKEEDDSLYEKEKQNCQSPVNIKDSLPMIVTLETPVPTTVKHMQQNITIVDKPVCSFSQSEDTFSNAIPSFSKQQAVENCTKHNIHDSLRILSSLSLADSSETLFPKSSGVFSTKTYGTSIPDLFSRRSITRKFVLAPAKLKSVTQTSWVAGGYWQAGTETPSLSRSSSQSSGFGSGGSNFAPSREPSVLELDRCSVSSDVTQNHNINLSASSFSHQKEQTLQMQSLTQRENLSNNYCTSKVDQCLQTHSQNNNFAEQHSGPTMTIVTSPAWLPALLCGSLLVNVIVLCTVLLR